MSKRQQLSTDEFLLLLLILLLLVLQQRKSTMRIKSKIKSKNEDAKRNRPTHPGHRRHLGEQQIHGARSVSDPCRDRPGQSDVLDRRLWRAGPVLSLDTR